MSASPDGAARIEDASSLSDIALAGMDGTAVKRRLAELADLHRITVGFWNDGEYSMVGRPHACVMADIDTADGHWRIRPLRGGDYRLAPDMYAAEHMVNIVLLDAQGARALAAAYRYERFNMGPALLIKPESGKLPGNAPVARHGLS
jgi:hypothetical protein